MKFTLSWLKDYLETDASVQEITDKLTAIGLELEGVEDPATALADFKVAEVISAEQHPDADRLRVLMVKTADHPEGLQVVCGAPNARAGMKGILALPGTYVPGLDITLKKSKIRGVESNGMMASERELCLGEDHDGIIDLDAKWDVGTPIADVYGMNDPIIDIAITPNRADCTGVYGVARDLAAAGMGTLKTPARPSIKENGASPIQISLSLEGDDAVACPHFMGRTIKGVKNGPSPEWLQQRLKAIGLRPISALVDITNYFCIGLCRPLHVFDADKLQGNLQVRMGKAGEKLAALNDKEYELDDFMTVVADDAKALALGGVIGGEDTGCTEDTVNVFLECAYFDPYRTAKTGRALQIDSDARYRFERGIDPEFTAPGLDLATAMILELCGGEASEITEAGSVPKVAQTVQYDPAYCEKIIGLAVDENEQKAILNRLGFSVNDNWKIAAPSWRADVHGKADIVEEVIRIVGYNNIPTVSVTRSAEDSDEFYSLPAGRIRKAKITLAARGMNETISYAFMREDMALRYGSDRNGKA
ncbi:MAG: phenylalanine--tRNA ligase subunit beta, partial [Pseudomonadota bacterium]|nr:phenylalanine--tRNA ligase subunit beta [Pseudomonadota bacterium]